MINSKDDLIEVLEDLHDKLHTCKYNYGEFPVNEDIYLNKISEMIEFIEKINITI